MEQDVTGYIDRIEEERFAVVLVDSLGKEFTVDVSRLPEGVMAGSYVRLTLADGEIGKMMVDEKKTASMEQEIADKLQRLKSRSPRSRFKRS